MSRLSSLRVWSIVAVLSSIPALAQAQQQFGDPIGHPGEYMTHASAPPNGTSIDVRYFTAGLTPAMSAAVTQAAAVWNAAGANVQLVTGAAPTTIFVIGTAGVPPPGNTNFSTTGAGTFPDGTSWNHITASLNIVDTTAPFFFGPGAPPPGQIDFLSYMIQQFGFALGLGSAVGPGSVMSALAPGTVQQTLSATDIAALQTLYGAPEPATWALFGVGLAALAALKKSRSRVPLS